MSQTEFFCYFLLISQQIWRDRCNNRDLCEFGPTGIWPKKKIDENNIEPKTVIYITPNERQSWYLFLDLTSFYPLSNITHPWYQGGSARRIACNLMNLNQVYEKHKNENFSYNTFTTGFKICLYARHFDSSVCPHEIFWWHFANSSKLLKNHLIAENLNEVKSSSLKK